MRGLERDSVPTYQQNYLVTVKLYLVSIFPLMVFVYLLFQGCAYYFSTVHHAKQAVIISQKLVEVSSAGY